MTVTDGPAIDLDALRRKYAEERAKRLRPDGNDQYLRLAGQLGHYLTDPYTPRAERAYKKSARRKRRAGGIRAHEVGIAAPRRPQRHRGETGRPSTRFDRATPTQTLGGGNGSSGFRNDPAFRDQGVPAPTVPL